MLPQAFRLLRQVVPAIFTKSQRFETPDIRFLWNKSEGKAKIAVVVSKAVVPKATLRNRLKRQLRHAVLSQGELLHSKEVILIAKRSAARATYAQLSKEVSAFFTTNGY